MRTFNTDEKIIAINDLRRRFGEIERTLPFIDRFILTKKGKPFAILSAIPSVKRDLMKKEAGAFKGTRLDNDNFWKDVVKKKSRKEDVKL